MYKGIKFNINKKISKVSYDKQKLFIDSFHKLVGVCKASTARENAQSVHKEIYDIVEEYKSQKGDVIELIGYQHHSYGESPLMELCRHYDTSTHSNLPTIQYLIKEYEEAGGNIANLIEADNGRAFNLVCFGGSFEIVQFFLEVYKKAKGNVSDLILGCRKDQNNPLKNACSFSANYKVVKYLIDEYKIAGGNDISTLLRANFVPVKAWVGSQKDTALICASQQKNNLCVVKLLIEEFKTSLAEQPDSDNLIKGYINHYGKGCRNASRNALQQENNTDVIEYLLSNGAYASDLGGKKFHLEVLNTLTAEDNDFDYMNFVSIIQTVKFSLLDNAIINLYTYPSRIETLSRVFINRYIKLIDEIPLYSKDLLSMQNLEGKLTGYMPYCVFNNISTQENTALYEQSQSFYSNNPKYKIPGQIFLDICTGKLPISSKADLINNYDLICQVKEELCLLIYFYTLLSDLLKAAEQIKLDTTLNEYDEIIFDPPLFSTKVLGENYEDSE